MILYYSASGNSMYIAKLLARYLKDDCLDLNKRIKEHDYTKVCSEKPYVICCPVYVCEMPRFLRDYLRRLPMGGCRDVYFVFTSGGYAGMSGSLAKGLVRKKGMNYKGHAELTMPSNHIVSNAYPPTLPPACRKRIADSTAKTRKIAACIKHGGRLTARYVFLFEKAIILPFNSFWTKYMFFSRDFYTTDKCIGCGKCARLCPISNITMENRKPVWGERCAHCMACILNCPFEAIEYSNITQVKDKYNIRKYVKDI